MRADTLEEHIWELIHGNLLGEPEYFRLELERRRAGADQQSNVVNRDVELITDKITTLERQLERWKVAYAGEAITLDEYAALKKPLDAEISALSRLHDELQGKLSVIHHRQEEINAAADFVRRVSDELPHYSLAEKRGVIEVLDLRVVYNDPEDMELHFLIPAEWDINPYEIWENPLSPVAPGTE